MKAKSKKKMSRGERVLQMVLVLPVLAFLTLSAVNDPSGAGWFLVFIVMMLIPAILFAIFGGKLVNHANKHGYRDSR